MEKKFKLGVVGAGFMASAIINGALNSGFLTPEQVIVSDLQTEKLYKLKERGLHITTDNSEILNNSEYVLFAVKPQSFAPKPQPASLEITEITSSRTENASIPPLTPSSLTLMPMAAKNTGVSSR